MSNRDRPPNRDHLRLMPGASVSFGPGMKPLFHLDLRSFFYQSDFAAMLDTWRARNQKPELKENETEE
jgi:hypothetical protein